jgi:hypothetical protein
MIEFRWVDLAVLALSILVGILVLAPHPPESKAVLIMIDDTQSYFACLERGCWNRVRADISFADLAAFTKTDERQLRTGNPQIHGDTVHAGDAIRISEAMTAQKGDH